MKKRILAIILIIVSLLAFCACGKNGNQAYNENLILNGSFETETGTTVSDWALDRYNVSAPLEYYQAVADETAPDGNNVLKIHNPENNDARFIQKVQVAPDSYYKLSAFVKTEDIQGVVSETGANICFLQTYCKSSFVKANSDWQEIVVYGKTDSKTTEVTVALRLGYYSADASGVAYFDNVSLERVKEVPDGFSATSMASFQFQAAEDNDDENKNNASSDKIQANVVMTGLALFLALVLFLLWAKSGLNLKLRDAYIIIGIALIIRLICSGSYVGFKVDIGCFSAWGQRMADVGLSKFYSEGYFCDYPPLYMIVLGIVSSIADLFKLSLQEGLGLVLLKLPACLADCLTAILIMDIAKKHAGEKIGIILGIGYALLPTAIVNSAFWGQVDSILVLFMLLAFWLMDEDKFGLSILIYFIGLLLKPQAILFGPVMLLGAIREFYLIYFAYNRKDKKEGTSRLIKGFGYLLGSVLLFALISVVMKNDQEPTWLIDKYMDTLGSYDYATLSSFGLMGLLKGQWVPSENFVAGTLTYATLGTILLYVVIFLTVLMFIWLVTRKNFMEARWLWALGAFMLAGAVTVSTRTHERYMFPVIAMLIMCFIRLNDKRFLFISIGYALLNFINTAGLLFLYEGAGVYFDKEDAVFIIGSLLTVLLFIYQAYVTIQLVLKGVVQKQVAAKKTVNKKTVPQTTKTSNSALNKLLEKRTFKLPKVQIRDIVICVLITAIYAVIAFTNLGDTKAPESYWQTGTTEVYVIADLGETKEFDSIAYKGASGSFEISLSNDGANYNQYKKASVLENSWQEINEKASARYVKIKALTQIRLEELVILKEGKPLEIKEATQSVVPIDKVSGDALNLFDNQESFYKEKDAVKTYWQSGGNYIITFEQPVNISDSYIYIKGGGQVVLSALASELGNLSMEEPWSQTLSFTSITDGWVMGSSLLESEILPPVQKVMITNQDMVSVGEILLLENGNVIKIKEITDENGNKVQGDILSAFDESESALESLLQNETAIWSITSINDYVLVDFGEIKQLEKAYYYLSLTEGSFNVYYSLDGEEFSPNGITKFEKSNLYYWHGLGTQAEARYVLVVANNQFSKILEMGFFEKGFPESTIEIMDIYASNPENNGGKALFDEQDLVPYEGATYMNSMYFDEIYHARTAYESANGEPIYEWTHPPLGKDFMAWSVKTLGMNPFAWRLAGTMAGVLMVPAIFFLALLMFRKTAWATLAALLMAFDGMHFVQTRIATIDSYGVLFIILMFLFMYWYYSISFYDMPLWKTFIPLGLCGLSFGLGAASKWICLYAGAGLAVIFFMTMFKRYQEYTVAKKALPKATGETRQYLQHVTNSFALNTCYTLLFCILVFIIVPLIIYCASYYPYWNAVGETRKWYEIIINNQKDMFNYHSKLEATHGYQSDWYTWPVMYLPMFYYLGPNTQETMSAIYSFGNPAVWYSGLVCTLLAIYVFVKRFIEPNKDVLPITKKVKNRFFGFFSAGDEDVFDKNRRDTSLLLFLVLALATNLLPWVGVNRCIFIYHYFASVPFIILFTVYIIRHLARKKIKIGTIVAIALAVVTVVLFFMFKPLWTGTSVSREFVKDYLRWLPSWFAYWFPN